MVDISVVVPTQNRPALLGHCLASLCEQTLDPARFEVCVVNNGSIEMTEKVLSLINTHYPKHRVFMIDEPRRGVAHARNAGVRNTKASLIAQGDDDATMPPDWLERFLNTFSAQEAKVGKIGGDIIPVWSAPRPNWLTDSMLPMLSASSGFGDQPRYMNEGLLEGNSCYRREALEAAGNFPASLGHQGNTLLSASHAVDLVMDIMGWKLYYDPSIVINHIIHADRLTPAWFRRLYFWKGVSDFAIQTYLKNKGVNAGFTIYADMSFDQADWSFINDGNEPPTEAGLNRLRNLGFVLASSGFIPS